MLLSGASIADVKEILRHSSIAITGAIELHSYENTKRAAVAGAALLLRKKVPNEKYRPQYRPSGQNKSGERCRSTAF